MQIPHYLLWLPPLLLSDMIRYLPLGLTALQPCWPALDTFSIMYCLSLALVIFLFSEDYLL